MDRISELKIKIKSLAEEARIIRQEEKKTVGFRRERLYLHRILNVRMESRASQLAYACLRGVPYEKVEPNARIDYCWTQAYKRAKKIALNFHPVFPWHGGGTTRTQRQEAIEQHQKKVEEWFNGMLQHSQVQKLQKKTNVTAA